MVKYFEKLQGQEKSGGKGIIKKKIKIKESSESEKEKKEYFRMPRFQRPISRAPMFLKSSFITKI